MVDDDDAVAVAVKQRMREINSCDIFHKNYGKEGSLVTGVLFQRYLFYELDGN